MRLDVNTSGAWKTVIPSFPPQLLEHTKGAVLTLARAATCRLSFRVVDTEDGRHPTGRVVAMTRSTGSTAEWINAPLHHTTTEHP